MSDEEFGTVNVKSQNMARELEALRQRYIAHRDTIGRLEADAPSEQLAVRYAELRHEIELALRKVDELGDARGTLPAARTSTAPGTAAVPPTTRATPAAAAGIAATVASGATTAPRRENWQNRSVLSDIDESTQPVEVVSDSNRRLLIIAIATLVVLGLLGALAYRYSRNRAAQKPVIVEQTRTDTAAPSSTAPATSTTTEAAAPASDLVITPPTHDFGVIRKGTRAVRQFRLENHSAKPMTLSIKRSSCRCLWFDYDTKLAPKSSSILAVTVDGAKAKTGALNETVEVKGGTSTATVTLQATIQ